MTIQQILAEAFERIKKEHKVALDSASFTAIASGMGEPDDRHLVSVSFSGDALRGGV